MERQLMVFVGDWGKASGLVWKPRALVAEYEYSGINQGYHFKFMHKSRDELENLQTSKP